MKKINVLKWLAGRFFQWLAHLLHLFRRWVIMLIQRLTMLWLSWGEADRLIGRLARMIQDSGVQYDWLVAVGRGGMFPAGRLAYMLRTKQVLHVALTRYKKGERSTDRPPEILTFPDQRFFTGQTVLVIDDVWDKGHSFWAVVQAIEGCQPVRVDTAALHFKPKSNEHPGHQPTYFGARTGRWVKYPWEFGDD